MNEAFKTIKENPCSVSPELVEALAAELMAAVEKTAEACKAYNDDLAARRATLTTQVEKYAAQLDSMSKKRPALVAKINDLSSRALFDEAADLSAELEELDKQIDATERKKKLADTAQLKGDPALHAAAKTAADNMDTEHKEWTKNLTAVLSAVDDEISRLQTARKDISFKLGTYPNRYAAAAFEKVNRHFHDFDRIEREIREKEAAERKAKEEAASRGAQLHVIY